MEIPVYDLRGKPFKTMPLPPVFEAPIRPDVIRRAVVALQTHRIQPQGRDPMAGKRTTARFIGTGYGISRIPRVKGERYPAAMRGAFAVGTVGGRRGHPPVVEKRVWKKVNVKERRLAIRSAIAATANREIVKKRGHVVDDVPTLPLVVADRFEKIDKTRRVVWVLKRLRLWPDVERAKGRKKVRAGKGKMRGRRYKKAKGPLIVVADDSAIRRAAQNLPGVDVVAVRNLNVELLAPGTHPGRLTLWTEPAIRQLGGLFR
ncbi:TPA: 50S ribosomal protein L4 [Candidatus Bathyarchaeota archaeon]|nr:50S ribosomal protein L4 [Candidatus Bathyarchaeota archaeon]